MAMLTHFLVGPVQHVNTVTGLRLGNLRKIWMSVSVGQ